MATLSVTERNNLESPIPLNAQATTYQGQVWEIGKEVAVTGLPFLTLYKPLSFPVALGMGAARVGISAVGLAAALQEGDAAKIFSEGTSTTIAVISVASTFFAHPLGVMLSTSYDLVCEMRALMQHLSEGRQEEALKSCSKILNHSLYAAVILCGGPEITICFLAVQMLSGALEARHDFVKGHYVSSIGHVLMTMVRGSQMHGQVKALQLKWELQSIAKAVESGDLTALSNYVGKLAEKWQFPSDHLPVGATVGNAHVISWNVLNNHFMEWVTDLDSQGLNGSMISKLHDQKSLAHPGLTMRDELVATLLLQIMNNPVHSDRLILTLQECSPEFVQVFSTMLPSHMGIVFSEYPATAIDHNVVLFNKQRFRYLRFESSVVQPFIKSDPVRPLMDLTFREKLTRQTFQVIHAHIPGAPDKPGKEEFAQYVLSHSRHAKPNHTTIALGDMNFTEDEMQAAFASQATALNLTNPFKNLSYYHTNINPFTFTAKSIDHLLVATDLSCKSMTPDEVLPGLQTTVDLLHPDTRHPDPIEVHAQDNALAKQEAMQKWWQRASQEGTHEWAQYRTWVVAMGGDD